jgi:hypothetical protein
MIVRGLRNRLGMLGDTEQMPGTLCTTSNGRRGVVDDLGNCIPLDDVIPDTGPLPDDGAPCTQIANGQPGVLVSGRCVPVGFVAPGATELHPERWDLDACLYTVAYGDTYVGICKTYLDPTGLRWRELWDQNRATTPDPDTLYPGQVLDLTGDACENMRRWTNRGGPPGVNPSEIGPATLGDAARSGWGLLALAAAAGGALYWMS